MRPTSVVRQGDMGDAAYIIIDGEADIVVNTPSGRFNGGDRWARATSSAKSPSSATCRGPRRSRRSPTLILLRITKDLFFRLVTEFPEMSGGDHARAGGAPGTHQCAAAYKP